MQSVCTIFAINLNPATMGYSMLIYHLVFGTLRRVTSIDIDNDRDLYMYMYGIIKNSGGHVYRIGGMPDHVHLIVSVPRNVSLSEFVKNLKQSSSLWLKNNPRFPNWEGWANGYGAFTCSPSLKDKAIQYVKNQKQHHAKVTFQDEYRKFLEDCGIEYQDIYMP